MNPISDYPDQVYFILEFMTYTIVQICKSRDLHCRAGQPLTAVDTAQAILP